MVVKIITRVYESISKVSTHKNINFRLTGLIDRAGTLEGAECETQKIPTGAIDWEINLYVAMQVTLKTYILVSKEMYSTVVTTIIKTIVVVI